MKKPYTPPKLSPGETRADRTDKVSREILSDEEDARRKKTERLKALRLERDDQSVSDTSKKPD